jgi:hypothetical protein
METIKKTLNELLVETKFSIIDNFDDFKHKVFTPTSTVPFVTDKSRGFIVLMDEEDFNNTYLLDLFVNLPIDDNIDKYVIFNRETRDKVLRDVLLFGMTDDDMIGELGDKFRLRPCVLLHAPGSDDVDILAEPMMSTIDRDMVRLSLGKLLPVKYDSNDNCN